MRKEEYLALTARRYEELEALEEKDNFYDYEEEFRPNMAEFRSPVFGK